jgi:hypothetical protein
MRFSAIKEKVHQNFLDMLAVDISIWPLIQTLNFTFVQPRSVIDSIQCLGILLIYRFHSVVVNTVSVVYNSILTYLLHGDQSYLQIWMKKKNSPAVELTSSES